MLDKNKDAIDLREPTKRQDQLFTDLGLPTPKGVHRIATRRMLGEVASEFGVPEEGTDDHAAMRERFQREEEAERTATLDADELEIQSVVDTGQEPITHAELDQHREDHGGDTLPPTTS